MIYELIFAGAAFFHPHAEKDSIGVETINGKTFVVHKVDDKETLYALSRRYGASVDEIRQSNPGLGTALEVGQIVKVPYVRKTASRPTAAGTTHKVAPKETMYSISRQYAVSVDDLRKWNNLSDNSLSVGQELIIRKTSGIRPVAEVKQSEPEPQVTPVPASGLHTVAVKETLLSIAKRYGLTMAQLRSWNALDNDDLRPGQLLYLTENGKSEAVARQAPVKKDPVAEVRVQEPVQSVQTETPAPVESRPQTIRISESMKNSDEIIESGVAELIEGTEGNRKYLALHKTAPVGTILKVRNEMNNREVFVRVMGKLPENSGSDKLIIRLSRSAYDRLGAIDPRFRVELTYYK